jgi:DNA-binding CsgD family transcriptional regulator
MLEPRPHRPARSANEAAGELRCDARAGRLDPDAAAAVLAAAGHRVTRPANVAGLTAREIDVLLLAVRGLSNKQIAASLVVAPKTVGNHIEHIYSKIGVSNRAGAALFAMRSGLLPDTGPIPKSRLADTVKHNALNPRPLNGHDIRVRNFRSSALCR